MDPIRFDLKVQSHQNGDFVVQVLNAPILERPSEIFSRPVGVEDLASFHQAAEDALHPSKTVQPAIPARKIGAALYRAVLDGEVGRLFHRCRDRVSAHPLELRLWFRLDDPQAEYLGALPWELLYSPETGEFLSRDRETPLMRAVQSKFVERPLAVEGPLQVLMVEAAPRTLDLAREITELTKALEPVREDIHLLPTLREPTEDELRDFLLDHPVHVLHFMGHGGYHDESGWGAIFLSDSDEREEQVTGEVLADILKGIKELRLVVLNACRTARYGNKLGSPLTHGVAAAVLERTTVQAVVAHQHSISDEAAIRFSSTFYKRLAARDGIDTAVAEARLRARWRDGWEWRTPVLFLNARETRLFAPEGVSTSNGRSRPTEGGVSRGALQAPEPLRLGIRSFVGFGADMAARTDQLLDLTELFDGRYIRDPSLWQDEVFPRLRGFLTEHARERRALLLDFAAHSSIACAAGWCLEAKSGFDVRVRQRVSGEGEIEWHPSKGEVPQPLWSEFEPEILDPRGEDVALGLSASQSDVADHARVYIEAQGLAVRRLWSASVAPEPGPTSVAGGAHARHLAQGLVSRLRERHPQERGGRCHLFCAAPNALMFYLGQLARSLAPLRLYEYAFGAADSYGRYQASIELPPPDETVAPPVDW